LHDRVAVTQRDELDRGTALLELGRHLEAEQAFAAALEADPESTPLRLGWALARYHQGGDLASAETLLRELEAARPTQPEPPTILGHLLLKEQRWAQAGEAFSRAEARAPRPHYSYPYARSLAASGAGESAEAIAQLERAVELEPHSVAAWYALSQALLGTGETARGDQALARFQQVEAHPWAERYELRYRGMGPGMMLPTPEGGPTVPIGTPPALTPIPRLTPSAGRACQAATSATMFDADGDGSPELLEIACGAPPRLLARDTAGAWQPGPALAGVPAGAQATGSTAGDFDGDSDLDLALGTTVGPVLLRNDSGTFEPWDGLPAATGSCAGVQAVDFDHDGDLDLHVARFVDEAGVPIHDLLLRNDGTGRFEDISALAGLATVPTRSTGGLWVDLDDDADLDLLQLDADGPVRLWANLRDGRFEEQPMPGGALPTGVMAAVAADLDGDARIDLAFASTMSAELTLLRANAGGGFDRSTIQTGTVEDGLGGLAAVDLSGRGHPGLALLFEERLAWLAAPFADETPQPLTDLEPGAWGVTGADLDRNGSEDLLLATARGVVGLAAPPPPGRWLRIALEGQLGSNPQGLHAVVEARADGHWQARVVGGQAGLLGTPTELTVALGPAQDVEVVRVHWPSGIRQVVLDPQPDRAVTLREQGLKSSCPQLYTWDGAAHRYISDLIGAAALGLQAAPGVGAQTDHDELIVLPPGALSLEDGAPRLRIVEPLEEILFVDELRLIAVDHPEGTDVVPRERYQFAPPRDPTGLIVLGDPQPLVSARDAAGNDLADALAERDLRAAPPLERAVPGFAVEHHMELDLGEAPTDAPVLLVLDGWVRYATMAEMTAAGEQGVTPLGPALDVLGADGQWREHSPDIGMPAGRPKTMVLDLTGAFDGPEQRIRIRSNLLLYWDRVRVDRSGDTQPRQEHILPLTDARLWRSGYPLASAPAEAEPLAYDGDHFRPHMDYIVAPGAYTRLGTVTPLLEATDDRMVVMSHGEAIDLRYDVSALPPVAPGWTRSWAVLLDGWMKDQEPGTLAGETVEPLPWHAMSAYPPPAGEEPPEAVQRAQAAWNTRWLPEATR